MMGKQDQQQPLFVVGLDVEQRIPADHPLRRVLHQVDFGFVRREVAGCYGGNGHESLDPQVVLKLLFLLFFDDLKSERELMRQLAYRLDYLWFLGLSLNEPIPHHSVLSKARRRWGPEVFRRVFVHTVQQCLAAGLIDGRTLHADSTLVQAHASKDSLATMSPAMAQAWRALCQKQEAKLQEPPEPEPTLPEPTVQEPRASEAVWASTASTPPPPSTATTPCASRAASTRKAASAVTLSRSDPQAAVIGRPGLSARARYKCHRAVDDQQGVITAVSTTPADVADEHQLQALIDQHQQQTGQRLQTMVADSRYGTSENYLSLMQQGIRPHLADLKRTQTPQRKQADLLGAEQFVYEPAEDGYRCPAGQWLWRRRLDKRRGLWVYAARAGVCPACPRRQQCTHSKKGRTIWRHQQQAKLEEARALANSGAGKRDRRRRQHLMEGSFAQGAAEHHLKHSRWRGLGRQRIQDYLIAAVQNVRILLRRRRRSPGAVAQPVSALGLWGAGYCWPAAALGRAGRRGRHRRAAVCLGSAPLTTRSRWSRHR